MKSTLFRGFAVGLALVIVVLAPACRSTRKKTKVVAATDTSATAPDISVTAAPPDQTIRVDTQEPDFVRDSTPTVEELPRDAEALNRYVSERRLVRDAFFGYDEAALSAEAQAALQATADWLRANPQYNILIEGHTDERGTEQYNLALGDRRGNIAREYLAGLGINTARMRTVSYGEERPFEQGQNEAAWAQNRRAHIVVVGSNQ